MAEEKNEGRIFLAQGLSGKLEFKVDTEGIFFFMNGVEIFRMHASEAKDLLKTIVAEFLAYNLEDAEGIRKASYNAELMFEACEEIDSKFWDGKITKEEAVKGISQLGLKPEVEADLIGNL